MKEEKHKCSICDSFDDVHLEIFGNRYICEQCRYEINDSYETSKWLAEMERDRREKNPYPFSQV